MKKLITPLILSATFLLFPSTALAASQTVYSWGDFGSAGPVSPIVDSPRAIAGIPGTITQIATSNSDSYALSSTGAVWAFGAGQYGELGNGTTTNSFSTPVEVRFPTGTIIKSLPDLTPYDTAMAIDSHGNIWGWGINNDGELCLGSTIEETIPVQLPLANVSLATGSGGHSLYDSNGVLYGCGDNATGDLGNGDTQDTLSPVTVEGLPHETVTALTSSYQDSGALLSDGSYWNWGLNNYGQLGNGKTTNSSVPVKVSAGTTVIRAVEGGNTANDGQTIVVLSSGKIRGWGSNGWGQLCNGSTASKVSSPIRISAPSGTTWVSFASGGSTSYGLDSSGNLWSCGANSEGEAGVGTESTDQVMPAKILSNVLDVSATSRNVLALSR